MPVNYSQHLMKNIKQVVGKLPWSFSALLISDVVSATGTALSPLLLIESVKYLDKDNEDSQNNIYLYMFLYVSAWTIAKAAGVLKDIFISRHSSKLAHILSVDVVRKYFDRPMSNRVSEPTSREVQLFINSYNHIAVTLLSGIFSEATPAALEVGISAGIIYRNDVVSGGILTGTLFFYALSVYFGSTSIDESQKKWNQKAFAAAGKVIGTLNQYENAHFNQKVDAELSGLDQCLSEFDETYNGVEKKKGLINLTQTLIIGSGFILSLYWSINKYFDSDDIDKNYLLLLVLYLSQFSLALSTFSGAVNRIKQGMTNYKGCINYLNERHDFSDDSAKASLALPPSASATSVNFESVSLSYSTGQNKKALDAVSFNIEPGTSVALVGDSGSGKTSILNLLFRFYLPDRGSIMVGGKDIAAYNRESLRSYFAVIPQSAQLTNETIQENIAYGISNPNHQLIDEAIDIAELRELVFSLPSGFKIGENGMKLSGGQRQRVLIARAVLRAKLGAKILFFDEPTSALDAVTAQNIISKIFHVTQKLKVTTFMITHNLGHVNSAFIDKIIMLKNGKVVNQGSVSELLSADTLFAQHVKKAGIEPGSLQEAPQWWSNPSTFSDEPVPLVPATHYSMYVNQGSEAGSLREPLLNPNSLEA